MSTSHVISPFSALWWNALVATVAVVALLLVAARRLPAPWLPRATRVLAILVLLRFAALQAHLVVNDEWTLTESLPLHLCGLTSLVAVIFLVAPRQWSYELVYYWGVAGSLHSLLTPVMTAEPEGFRLVEFYVSHGGTLFVALYATFVLGLRPRPGSWWRVFLWTQLCLPIIGGIDWLLSANYMFLREPPEVANPFMLGEPPWHIVGLEVAAVLHFALLYAPFGWATTRQPRRASA